MVIFAVCLVSIKYDVEGETNMPYILSKIAIISSSQGNDKEEKKRRKSVEFCNRSG